jgi:predicted dinucleotide-binding enzyme
MSYAIVGFGKIGQALAHAFARKNIEVTVDGLRSSAFVAKSFTGAKVVKGFNHLVAATLATDPIVEGGHRVVFLSSDDEDATAPVADLAKQLGFAPVKLGKLNEGGALMHARGQTWGQLIFQDLSKKEQ